jgi:hypothetical protein
MQATVKREWIRGWELNMSENSQAPNVSASMEIDARPRESTPKISTADEQDQRR